MKNVAVALIALMIGCKSPESNTYRKTNLVQFLHLHGRTIPELDHCYTWISNEFYPFFNFEENQTEIFMTYDGQCGYYYPIISKKDKLIVLFSNRLDCTHDIGLDSAYGLQKHPKLNEPFMEFTTINDSLIKVKQLFPQWADSVNAQFPLMPLFADSFHLVDFCAH